MTHHHAEGLWLPLTLAQMDFWEEFRLHPGEAVSTVAHAIELRGVADPKPLVRAIKATIAETDIMALCFQLDAQGQPMQRVDPARRPRLRCLDLAGTADARDRAFALMRADVGAALDLLGQPIAAQWLVRLADGHYLWFNRSHHIAVDGYAMGLVERRCARLYGVLAAGADPGQPLGGLAAYLNEEQDYRAGPRHSADGRHWAEVLAGVPRPRVLRKGSEDYPAEALSAAHDLSALRPAIIGQAQTAGLGWPDLATVICAAWAGLHLRDGSARHGHDGQGRICMPVWLPYMSRMGSVAIAVPALVVNILPLDVTLNPAEPLGEALARLGARLRQLRRHGRYRIEQIAQDCGMEPRSRFFFSPLINVLPFDEPRFPGCETARHVLSNGPGDGFNITIRGDGEARGLDLLVEADPTLTPPGDFEALAQGLPRFLAAALMPENQARPLAELAL
ncbi:enterobactin synthetase component F [Paracoccus thiocyanatus]|uniref:Enterobactin synthetase component F n=1 Tax=Paracoccus thiocyanatus TaxID=34006 RepID=A0A1N6XS47_9RHOB|nr:condensation domain-containing protein [Paracoccus thiocyanatus]SIR05162.1 enterobactin synthetase component F [Paracoccus thiocyanatus]